MTRKVKVQTLNDSYEYNITQEFTVAPKHLYCLDGKVNTEFSDTLYITLTNQHINIAEIFAKFIPL